MKNEQCRKNIWKNLEKCKVPDNKVLMIHSSFKSFSRNGYDAETTLKAFVDYMKNGTLLMPAMSWRHVNAENPVFNELTTPSNTGVLTEIFRVNYSKYRSIHPTHSVCGIGKYAEEVLSKHHECITPCGEKSPFGVMSDIDDSYVLMFGVGIDCCTLIHHGEEDVASDIYCRSLNEIETYKCITRSEKVFNVNLRRHKFLPRNFWQFQDELASENKLSVSLCDNAPVLGFKAKDLIKLVKEKLKVEPNAILARSGDRYRLM